MNSPQKGGATSPLLGAGWEELIPAGYAGGMLQEPDWRHINELMYRRHRHMIIALIRMRLSTSTYFPTAEDFLHEVLIMNMQCLKKNSERIFRMSLISWLLYLVNSTMRRLVGWRLRIIVGFHGMRPLRPGVWRQIPPWSIGPRWDSFRNMSLRDFYEI